MKASAPRERTRGRLEALARAHFGAAVESLAPLRGDASDRAYVRLAHPGGARASSVGMIAPGPFRREALPFIGAQEHFRERGVRVPEIFTMDEAAGVLLLEDCGDDALEDVWNRGGWAEAERFYAAAIDALALIQESPPSPAGGWAPPWPPFDPAFFTNELRRAREYAFERLLNVKTDGRALGALFLELCEEICRQPFRLVHRDYHSRNLMVADGGVFVLDFQDARMGPVLYDLASLAFDSYAALGEDERESVVRRYWEACGRRHFSDKEEYERALRATAIQRGLKAIGTFAYQKAARGEARYLGNIPRAARMLHEHFEKRRDLARLRGALGRFLEAVLK